MTELSNAERHAETLSATLGALGAAITADVRRVERLIRDSEDALHRTRSGNDLPNSEAHRDRWDAVTTVLNEAAGLVPGIKAKMDEARGVQGEMLAAKAEAERIRTAQAEAERKAAEKAERERLAKERAERKAAEREAAEAEKARRAALTPAERAAEDRLAELRGAS